MAASLTKPMKLASNLSYRVATRYDKLLANFMGFVKLAAIAIWLK